MSAREAARAVLVMDLVLGGLSPQGAEERVAGFEQADRSELAEEFATAIEAIDPVEWALAGQHAGHDAAALVRRMAAPTTTQEPS